MRSRAQDLSIDDAHRLVQFRFSVSWSCCFSASLALSHGLVSLYSYSEKFLQSNAHQEIFTATAKKSVPGGHLCLIVSDVLTPRRVGQLHGMSGSSHRLLWPSGRLASQTSAATAFSLHVSMSEVITTALPPRGRSLRIGRCFD